MNILEMRALRGPNYYSNQPVIFMNLDIQELELKPSDLVYGLRENIEIMMPSLYQHTCSPGKVGGFLQRVTRGTWAGHIVEHVAIELQVLAGLGASFGKTYTTDEIGIYKIAYRYLDENVGLRAGEMAVDIVEKLFQGVLTDIQPLILELKEIAESSLLGPSTISIVNEATKRGIPHIRLNQNSYVQLGYGKYQRRIQATMMDNTSALGVEIADDKARTKRILFSMGIPVPKGITVASEDEALKAAEEIGYPIVVKPLVGNHGRGVTTNIKTPEELIVGFRISKDIYNKSIVEKYLKGFDFRMLVIDGKFVAAALREPAYVIGNGIDNIDQLINEINKDPHRGNGHEKNLTKIVINHVTNSVLEMQNLHLGSIPMEGEKIYIKSAANLSAGGTARDVTDTVHHINRFLAERISKIIGLNVMGIDIVAENLEKPLEKDVSGVVEVNAAPGFRMHLNPSIGNPRNIGASVVDMLFPKESQHSVPIVAVTGTNGKTTVTRLIANILGINSVVGLTSTDGAFINNICVAKGDYSGPEGAEKILMDPTVENAVLEVARGGILRRGLGFKECDVGVLMNISCDHLGSGGINTLEELTRLKSTVTEAVKPTGYAVYNADDELVLSRLNKTKGTPILFSKNPENIELKKNLENGNMVVTVIDNNIVLQSKSENTSIVDIMEVPITFNGSAGFNIENALAAVSAAIALGVGKEQIKAGLTSFISSIDQSPGRMNIIDIGGFKVVIDYGHNPGAIKATGDFIRGLMPGRKIRMTSSAGNRRDIDILQYAENLSKYFDHIIICDPDIRQRKYGETADIIKKGLLKSGFKLDMITIILEEREATKATLDMARQGDLVLLQADNIIQVTKDVLQYKKELESASTEYDSVVSM